MRSYYVAAWMMAVLVLIAVLPEKGYAQEQRTLQEAVDAAKAGEKIEIGPGMFRENVVISKPVHLIGKGTVIDGGGKGNVVEIKADGVTIEGFTITNSGRTGTDSGIFLYGSHATIIRNQFVQVQTGISLNKSQFNQIVGNRFESNGKQTARRGNGILMKGSHHNLVSQNMFYRVLDGVYAETSNQNEFKQNTVQESRYAFHLMGSAGNVAQFNQVSNNVTGLMIMTSSDTSVLGNEISGHVHYRGYGVIVFDSQRTKLSRNQIVNNNTGIMLQETGSSQMQENIVAGNSIGMVMANENRDSILSRNSFIGNVVQAQSIERNSGNRTMNGDQIGNYWDDYTGLDMNGDLIGDVDYEAGAMYERLVEKKPELQLFFESPAVKILHSTEKLVATYGAQNVRDSRPLMQPLTAGAAHSKRVDSVNNGQRLEFLTAGSLLLAGSFGLFWMGRRRALA